MSYEHTLENLRKHGFSARYFETCDAAVEMLCAEIRGKSVGFGASVTLDELGVYDLLCRENTVSWHWKQPGEKTLSRAAQAQIYLCSANAISETGEIVNIDGHGNRLASMLYGHERLYLVAGVNKIAPDLSAAIERVRNVAAPKNAIRLGKHTPCALAQPPRCFDCSSPDRICAGLCVLTRPCTGIERTEVVLIGQALGY